MRKILLSLIFLASIFISSCNYAGSSKSPIPPLQSDGEVTWFQNEIIGDMFLYEGAVVWGEKLDEVKDINGNPVCFYYYDYSITEEDKYFTNFPADKNKLYYCDDKIRSPGFYFKPSEDESDIKQQYNISNVIEYYLDGSNIPFLWKTKFDMGEDTYLVDDSFNDLQKCRLTVNTIGMLYKNAATVILSNGGTLYGDNADIDDVIIEPNGKLVCDKMVFNNKTIYFVSDFEPD